VGEDDSDGYVVGIRQTDAPDSWSLLFMECHDAEGPHEIALGMDTYCLVVGPGKPPTMAVSESANWTVGGFA
jgi:hypothetical protein